MVASPNVDFGGADGVANILAGQQRQLDEQGRQTKYPFIVSRGGVSDFAITPSPTGDDSADVTIGYGDGFPLLRTRTATATGRKVFEIVDHNGQLLFASDPVTGYGLAAPYVQWSLYYYDPPQFGITGSGFYPIFTGNAIALNPAVQSSQALKLVSSGAATMQTRWHLWDPNTGFSTYSAVQQLSRPNAGTSYANSALQATLLPSTEIGGSLIADLEARMSAGSGTAYASPNYFVGASATQAASIGGW